MPPFRNLLNRKPATSDGNDDKNETTQSQQSAQSLDVPRSTPLSLNNSREEDISARSPVLYADNIQSRTSLDSRFSRLSEHPSTKGPTTGGPESMEEETFEDVGLADEDSKPRKRGLFARFGDNSSDNTSNNNNNNNRPSSSHLGFRLPGRKRAQSGQGAELSNYGLEVPTTEV
ncbi:conserved hypothetical protein [Talaromyces marneffei ATCC 18224]|uniref:Uncharacterized protein n=1 Tax=Talaromyces marneffei (strain ATCC 18224 / CBS 334.59 / QM 7333) TaxID=441960 RepID=B6QS20_TALMQ|nr:conserved hypothetical protein [Talaromyces marneffei ATCC 18224]